MNPCTSLSNFLTQGKLLLTQQKLYLLNVWVKHELKVKEMVKKGGCFQKCLMSEAIPGVGDEENSFQKCLMSEAIPGVGDEENRIKLFYQQCLFPAQ